MSISRISRIDPIHVEIPANSDYFNLFFDVNDDVLKAKTYNETVIPVNVGTSSGTGTNEGTWTSPNMSTWLIKEEFVGNSVEYIDTPVIWFNPEEFVPEGYNDWDFRGATIDYHAYLNGHGTMKGIIQIVVDVNTEVDHRQIISGSLGDIVIDDVSANNGKLSFSDSIQRTLLIHYKLTTFWGQEYWC